MLSSLALAASVVGLALANPFDSSLLPRAACDGNTASTRSQWCDYDLSTDWYNTVPDTGVTREYWLDLSDTTVSPDGVSRYAMAINGSIPGPTLYGDWGDYFIVHVTNSLTQSTNGTSIHFHGIRQNYTVQNDGVVSITQCPVAPGSSITYEWRATQYGSTWYHSHFALQAWEGVFGGIIINGPASANYDVDLGHMFLNDWDHSTVDELYITAETEGPPTLDTGLLNGTNVYGDDDDADQTGYRWNTTLTEGTSYRMRLVNAAVDTHWKFSIDNHTIGVIAMDLVPIVPYNTTTLSIGMGQRYDIIIYTDGMTDIATDFWMRAIPQTACSDNDNADNIKGIISYGTTVSTPSTTAYDYTDSCDDEDVSTLVPYLSKTVSGSTWDVEEPATVATNDDGYFRWYLNSTTMEVKWANPTLGQIYNGTTSWDDSSAVVTLDGEDEWAYVIIETTLAVPHPIHLHGFDFFVVAQGSGTYTSGSTTLNLDNPPRRDTAMLPASGYLVLAFETDNPGAWLMHCHIGWHTSEGFAMQWIVRQDEITDLIDYDSLESTCDAWDTHAAAYSVTEDDSGV
ncbi:putative multicopper oxidase [Diaporthe ampelina]|uniref:laccase n=1 Tax=Diaporthe ampelina TaxID=1214573 RepID=A0A0G2FGD2_9PEZI|nr:putative multicopper oxidase [Diaporthe ampelina]